MKMKILAMAIDRKSATRLIRGLSFPLAEHIGYVLLYPTSQNRHHWILEINNYMNRVMNWTFLKGPNGTSRMKYEMLFDLLYVYPLGHPDQVRVLQHRIADHMKGTNSELNVDQLKSIYDKVTQLCLGVHITTDKVTALFQD